jgi:multimeric flavodoxin WrbA
MKNEMTSALEKISECDALILGSYIYLDNITGEMHSFLEHLIFRNTSYNFGG